MPIPIPPPRPNFGQQEYDAVNRVMTSGQLAQGTEVAAFEAEFSKIVDGLECVAVNSGTSALLLGLLAIGIVPGDEVIVPSFTFAATANAVVLAGATPVFVDIHPADFCIDPAAIEAAITPRTTGIIAVHLFGQPARLESIKQIADRHQLALIEDAAQAHAASVNGKPVGTFGQFGAFSFYPTKNMTCGEGGMITTPDSQTARRSRLLRNQGMERRYQNELVGFNARMTEIQATIGRVQLTRLPDFTDARTQNAQTYYRLLSNVRPPGRRDDTIHVYNQFTVRVPRKLRESVVARLDELGIPTGIYYPTPVHRLPSYNLSIELAKTESACAEVFSLPIHPGLGSTEIEYIAYSTNQIVAELTK